MENQLSNIWEIRSRIFNVRGRQVMLDSDLALLYGVSVKRFNEQVKRNADRFPIRYRFQITKEENDNLRSQFATSSSHGGRRYLPYVFTEQGVSMLSAVLKSETAIKVSIQIIDAFVGMRRFLINNESLFQKINSIENKQLEYDEKFDVLFRALDKNKLNPDFGIFYNGQMFDAYTFVSDLIRGAKTSILLIDNYIDDTVLNMFSKSKNDIKIHIYTKRISKQLLLDIEKYNSQYSPITIKEFTQAHDRFLIIDKTVYHFGASLKDLGKKWFAFSKMLINPNEIVQKLN